MSRALVLACGNSLRGDDGVALQIMNHLQKAGCDPAPEFPRADLEKARHDISQPEQFKINFDYLARRVKRRGK